MPLVRSAGVRIHYESIGWDSSRHGSVPLLLHTGAGGDLRMWREAGYVSGLAPWPLLLIDHRGHGSSDRPPTLAAHSIDRYVDDVVAVLDHAGAEQATFIGYSDGAAIGFAFSAGHPDRTMALIGLGALGGEEETQAERRSLAEMIRTAGMQAIVDGLAEDEPDPVPTWFADQMRSTDSRMFALELEGWADWAGPWSTLASMLMPTLIIVGELEDSRPGLAGSRARGMAARLPQGQVLEIPAIGHVGLFTRTDITLPAIRSFLGGLPRSGA